MMLKERVLARSWLLVGTCWYSMCGMGQPACGHAQPTHAEERPTPKVWLQQYLGVQFPDSARHFVLYYRSDDEDVLLFSFDVAQDGLEQLMDGTAVFPVHSDLAKDGADLPEQIVRDSASRHFAQKVTAMQNGLSASRRRTRPAEPLEVCLWTAEVAAGTWRVCVSVIADAQADRTSLSVGFKMPVAHRDMRSHVIIDSRSEYTCDTHIWQRWSLDGTGYRELVRVMETRQDVARRSSVAAERLAARLDAGGPAPEVPWWKPSELNRSRAEGSEPLEGFRHGDSTLVVGRVDGLFHGYALTQRHVLATDPLDAIWRLLGLQLPTGVHNAHYESASSMAGIVFWIRFDVPLRDFMTCLAQAPALAIQGELTAGAVVRQYLETAYQTGSPDWWRPQELRQGLCAQHRSNSKDLTDITAGLGPLSERDIRVYIGAFSPW
ncbi:MAG: hypothetical protein JW993_13060 [Sedimentisphaerales bacterium]|nr:hypothetical protein [Sedimentisphaerales bacterium]